MAQTKKDILLRRKAEEMIRFFRKKGSGEKDIVLMLMSRLKLSHRTAAQYVLACREQTALENEENETLTEKLKKISDEILRKDGSLE